MYRLDPDHFDQWFFALNGVEPFPWQRRLFRKWLCADQLLECRWPKVISLPTASGKTAVIEMAVFALACGSPAARRRIAFVVDRRLVVDEATRRAELLARKLQAAIQDEANILGPVARALVETGGEPDAPLAVARLRGGIEFDDSWAKNPAQPTVIVSTVDQVGSRLLFRAYGGVGKRSLPIPAGLLGVDTLIIVDEAHCSQAFCDTVHEIEEKWQRAAEQPLPNPLTLVRMSATLPDEPEFRLEQEDQECEELRRRLFTAKPVKLETVRAEGSAKAWREMLENHVVEEIRNWTGSRRGGVCAVVLNRVQSARKVFEQIGVDGGRKMLLTGRMRPWDRDRLLREWLPKIEASSSRPDSESPLVVVATQCIEVGANLDFDFMVTEAAPLDALRQRFGRVNRLGIRGAESAEGGGGFSGVIVAHPVQCELDTEDRPKASDEVYGDSLCLTWNYLLGSAAGPDGVVDFSHSAMSRFLPEGGALEPLLQPSAPAPPLLPAYLDLLAHTNPPPDPDVDIAEFLHGARRNQADVTVVWRSGLVQSSAEDWVDRIAIQPPAPGEGCPVPVWEVRRWLSGAGTTADGDSDIIGLGESTDGNGSAGRTALRWKGPEDSKACQPQEIRPGDLLVVPAEYGGCTEFGWDPSSERPVADIGDAVAESLGRRPVLRLSVLQQMGAERLAEHGVDDEAGPGLLELIARFEQQASEWEEEPERQGEDTRNFLADVKKAADSQGMEWLAQLADRLMEDRAPEVIYDKSGRPLALAGSRSGGEDAQTGSETSSFAGRGEIRLESHMEGVAATVNRWVRFLNLPGGLQRAVILAARFHDLGKADPRFQAMLRGKAFVGPLEAERLLAKSPVISPRNLAAMREARRLSGCPEDFRHEALSAFIVETNPELLEGDLDQELVLHLIGSHHGYGRPWFPVSVDRQPVRFRLAPGGTREIEVCSDHRLHCVGGGTAARFWRLNRRYGWWGLAYLESLLRLADQRRSAEEECNGRQG